MPPVRTVCTRRVVAVANSHISVYDPLPLPLASLYSDSKHPAHYRPHLSDFVLVAFSEEAYHPTE